MKREEELLDAIGQVGDDLVAEAKRTKKKRKKWWLAPVAAALALAILAGVSLAPGKEGAALKVNALAAVQYPETVAYPKDFEDEKHFEAYEEWWQASWARREQYDVDTVDLDGFYRSTMEQFLTGTDGENRVYSPLNIYIALGMLAEITDGNSRRQILDALGAENMETLRQQVELLWNANYVDDGLVTSILASSLWLREGQDYNQQTLRQLAETYCAESFAGEMGSADLNQAFQSWLNERTGNLLEDQIGELKLKQETVIALATTIYFKASWSEKFAEGQTRDRVFHGSSGDELVPFMYRSDHQNYYWGENFSAVEVGMSGNAGGMTIILPDEGVAVEDLLTDKAVQDFLLGEGEWENQKSLTVNLYLPKFDVSSQLDLSKTLPELGITDVFDPAVSDFTPLSEDLKNLAVSQAQHGARVTVDEGGCVATAYTIIMMDECAMEFRDEMDFVVDRPFLFVITSDQGCPLFIGVVNHP